MNFIHSPYQASGKITQTDLLYTLSVFMTEPVRWVERYEWRTLGPMEVCAIGTFWKGIADDMGIEYHGLLEGGKSGKGWKDGIEFWDDVAKWARGYEEKFMVPAISNQKVGDETANLLLNMVPLNLRGIAKKTITCLMEERLRASMM